MALVAWYPLNGDLKNNGDSSFDIINKTVEYGAGKIGKALDFHSKPTYIETKECPIKTTVYSISIWLCVSDFSSHTSVWAQTIISSRTAMGLGLSMFIRSDKGLRIDPSINSTGNQWNTNYRFEKEKWTHLVLTNNNGTITYYINGELKESKKTNSTIDYIDNQKMRVGASYHNNLADGANELEDNFFNGYMNDLRIYDHCLSQSEIKEIYKTPILKYNFDYPLVDPRINTANNLNMTWNVITNNCANIGTIIYNKEYVTEDQCFTMSFDLEIKDIVGVDGEKTAMTIQDNTVLDGTTSSKWSTIINSNEIYGRANQFASSDGTREVNLNNSGKYHICRTYRISNVSRFKQNWNIQIRTDNIISGIAKMTNFRVVLGEKEIPYDGSDLIVYDESGMGNDGKLVVENETFLSTSYSTNAKIGEGCYVSKTSDLDGKRSYGYIKTIDNFYEIPEFSIAFWIYKTESKAGGGIEGETVVALSKIQEKWDAWIRVSKPQNLLLTTMYGVTLQSAVPIELNKWQYVVVTVQKTGMMRMYINGKESNHTGMSATTAFDECPLTIGELRPKRYLGLNARLDDLRIYATALDEEEIKRMYSERARVDSNGNLYCGELIETSGSEKYIRSDGNQYIDTEIIVDQDTDSNIKIEMKVANLINVNRYSAMYGTRFDNSYQFWSFIEKGVEDKIKVRYSGREFQATVSDLSSPMVIAQDQNGFYINGEKVVDHFGKFLNSNNIYLFNVDNKGVPQAEGYGIIMDLYYCKIWKNEELIRDFVPAHSNEVGHINEVCLYDLVSNRCFYNMSGNGDFIMCESQSPTSSQEVKVNGRGIVNCGTLNEGKNIAKIINKNSIFETNQINEN